MAVRLGSNISAIQAQRRLGEASSSLSNTFERLSSGQRINRASDDAAGLSVASSLGAARRVYTQAVRNLNDGVSALQIADSAVENLSQIVTRIRELAEQAANGALSLPQREAIDMEAHELQDEYLRVSRAASFNGIELFDGSLAQGLRLQAGFGTDGSIQSSLGGRMGSGTFSLAASYATGDRAYELVLGDLNGDGALDIVTANTGDQTMVMLGNGEGSFGAATTIATGYANDLALGDLNGDGMLDLVTLDQFETVHIFMGQGDGSFGSGTTFTAAESSSSVTLHDLNGDGALDIMTVGTGIGVQIGDGSGGFTAAPGYSDTGLQPGAALTGDFNGDGIQDVVVSNYYDATLSVLMGNGDGSFAAGGSVGWDTMPYYSLAVGDLNGDDRLDIVTVNYPGDSVAVFLGNGEGNFSSAKTFSAGYVGSIVLGDVNGDGRLDVVNGAYGTVLPGNGDGSFGAAITFQGTGDYKQALGDLNGDGVLDLTTADTNDGNVSILLGETREGVAPLLPFSLVTQADALQALAPLDRKIDQLSAQRGVIGAFQSRISVAANTLQSASENYAAAESRIRDADIASEAAHLARLQISQEAAAAVLAQANQQPALAVKLLQ